MPGGQHGITQGQEKQDHCDTSGKRTLHSQQAAARWHLQGLGRQPEAWNAIEYGRDQVSDCDGSQAIQRADGEARDMHGRAYDA